METLEPTLNLMQDFAKATNGVPSQINSMRDRHIFRDGEIPTKYKALTAMVWSIASRCEPCIHYYVSKASKHGATEGEVGEFLAVASTMGGCVGEMWSLKAYKAFKESQGEPSAHVAEPTCC